MSLLCYRYINIEINSWCYFLASVNCKEIVNNPRSHVTDGTRSTSPSRMTKFTLTAFTAWSLYNDRSDARRG